MLDQNKAAIKSIADARKEKITADGAWQILKVTSTLIISKGKKILKFSPSDENKDEILANALGRSGTLRAPTLIIADKVIVGFQDDLYNNLPK